MKRKKTFIVIKIISTLILIYSVFMILLISIFDLLSLSIYISFITFFVEKIIPNISAVIALIFLIRYIWIPDKKSNLPKKDSIDNGNS